MDKHYYVLAEKTPSWLSEPLNLHISPSQWASTIAACTDLLHLTQTVGATPEKTRCYRILHHPDTDIRLLKIDPKPNDNTCTEEIHCDLIHAGVHNNLPYKALSYIWGLHSDDTEWIVVNNEPFQVHRNLYHALQRIQRDLRESLYVWIDSICINQSDINERNVQVARMRELYEQAQQVIVWLGPEADQSSVAIKSLHTLHAARDAPTEFIRGLDDQNLIALLIPIAHLFKRPYWQRIWIVQEFMAAKDVIVYCGVNSIKGNVVQQVQAAFFLDEPSLPCRLGVITKSKAADFWDDTIALYLGGPWPITMAEKMMKQGRTLFETLKYLHRQKATDPRDMIFSMANSYRNISGHKVDVNYELSTCRLYTNFSKKEIEDTGRLDLFGSIRSQAVTIPGLPSWAIDWTLSDETGLLDNPFGNGADNLPSGLKYHASADTPAEVIFSDRDNIMTVKGLKLGAIDDINSFAFHSISEVDQTVEHAFREWCQLANRTGWDTIEVYDQLACTILYDFLELMAPGHKFPHHKVLKPFFELGKQTQPDPEIPIPLENAFDFRWEGGLLDHETMQALFLKVAGLIMCNRKVFSSSRSLRLGFCPSQAQKGDFICIAFGCDWPIVLRQQSDGFYTVIGPAFMYDFMRGEAVEMMKAGDLESEYFSLR